MKLPKCATKAIDIMLRGQVSIIVTISQEAGDLYVACHACVLMK